MTEPRLRDIFVFLEAHRGSLIEHAGALAEIAEWARTANLREAAKQFDRIATRCERIAIDLGAALEVLHRIYPVDPQMNEDTHPGVGPVPSPRSRDD